MIDPVESCLLQHIRLLESELSGIGGHSEHISVFCPHLLGDAAEFLDGVEFRCSESDLVESLAHDVIQKSKDCLVAQLIFSLDQIPFLSQRTELAAHGTGAEVQTDGVSDMDYIAGILLLDFPGRFSEIIAFFGFRVNVDYTDEFLACEIPISHRFVLDVVDEFLNFSIHQIN